FRDLERAVRKPPGTFRVAVLGDSFIQATEVSLEDAFPMQLQTRLNGCRAAGDRGVEVLGFGVRSFGTAQELLLLQNVVRQYEPHLVVLAFCAGNDVMNNSRELDGDPYKPYFRLVDSRLAPDLGYREEVQRKLTPRSRFWYREVVQWSRLAQLLH